MKLFKTLLISLFLISNIFTQDISGNFKLSGLSAVYYDFVRQETSIYINDNYGIGINVIGDTYIQGKALRYDYQLPTKEEFVNSAGVQLLVNFYEDGTASIAQGSTYPTSITEDCISTISTLPVTGDQGYSSNLNSGATIPQIDIVGLPSKSIYAGQNSGSCSITSSPVFDIFPQNPTEVSIPFPINTTSISEELGELLPANTILPGQTAGYALLDHKMVSTVEQNTGTRPSLYLEWHAIDGPVNDSGLGDNSGDEDGDGTDYDSIYGLEIIRAMYNTNLTAFNCGNWNYPIAGRNISGLQSIKEQECISEELDSDCIAYAADWIDNCIKKDKTTAEDDDGSNLYVLENDPIASTWGGLLTWNSYYLSIVYEAVFTNCLSQGIDSATCYSIATNNEEYLALFNTDDSDHDFNDECLSNGDYSDCSGRLTFSYSPQCLPSFSVRYFMAELTELCETSEQDECGICGGDGPVPWYNDADRDGLGDPNNFKTNCLPGYCIEDEALNYSNCNDTGNTWDWLSMGVCSNENGTVENISHLIPIFSDPVGDFEYCNWLKQQGENTTWIWDREFSTSDSDPDDTCINIDEYHDCGGVCFTDADNDTICDDVDDCIEETGASQECGCNTGIVEGTCDCDGNIDLGCGCGEGAATDDDGSCESLSIGIEIIPDEFSIQSVYPNPFNPVITIAYGVPTSQYTEGYIYNLNGARVITLVSQYQPAGNYSVKWNATGEPSGIYIFILKTESEVKSQKLVLLK